MNIAIIDDDLYFLNNIEKKIKKYSRNLFNISIDTFANCSLLFFKKYDIYFLDIDIPSSNGIDIAKKIKATNSLAKIIFITSHVDLVFSAITIQPFYFIRKQNLDRDMKELFRLLDVYYKKTMKLITFNYYGRKTSIFLKNIHYIESYGKDVSVITNNEVYTYRSGLKQTLDLLDNKYIIRVHRNYAVSLMYVKEIDRSNIILNDNTILPIGKKYSNNLLNLYK